MSQTVHAFTFKNYTFCTKLLITFISWLHNLVILMDE